MTELSDNEQVIARELAALGEALPSEDELGFVRAGSESRVDIDVRNVGALIDIGHPEVGEAPELLPLAQRRVWKVVADRGAAFLTASPPKPTSQGHSGQSVWRAVVGAVAVAAGVVLVPRLAPPTEAPSQAEVTQRRADMQAAGQAARTAVAALKGPVGSERAQSMADAYAKRLKAQRQGAPR